MTKLINKLMLAHCVWLISVIHACSFSSKTSKKLLERARKESVDLVIVPGAPFDKEWSRTMKGRIYWSKYLYDEGIAKNIMYSGSSVYTAYVEAEIMAMYAEAIGIPKEHVFTETKAEHSTQNVDYGYRKAKQLHFNRIALASDPFQTKLLQGFARRKVSPEIQMIPMVADTLKALEPTMINPQIHFEQAYNEHFVPLRKRESWWKRLKGTLGLNIDKNAYP